MMSDFSMYDLVKFDGSLFLVASVNHDKDCERRKIFDPKKIRHQKIRHQTSLNQTSKNQTSDILTSIIHSSKKIKI